MSSKHSKTKLADKNSFLMIVDLLTEMKIRFWVEGGWGIDVLIGKQTRDHRDIDIDFDAAAESRLLKKLSELDFQITTDERPTRVEFYHPKYGFLDLHPFDLSQAGIMKQADPAGGWFELEAEWFTTSVFEGRNIPCVSFEGQKLFHSGYELREVDRTDLKNLHTAFSEKNIFQINHLEDK